MDTSTQYIPIVDLQVYNVNVDKANVSDGVLETLSKDVVREFEKVGFCYIINHGINDEFVQRYMSVCRQFFELPRQEKKLYEWTSKESNHGWIGAEEESLNNEIPGDLKETFNFCPGEAPDVWPSNSCELKDINQTMFDNCLKLGNNLLEVLAIGLGLDRNRFLKDLRFIGRQQNATALRSLHYPPLAVGQHLKPGQVRLGEHSDYGTITILFQDDVGGLEVKVPNKGFVHATPIPGAALVNIGDMMQRLTSDRLIATRHRIGIPESEAKRGKSRQSVAFFINPDDDVMIQCLDGSRKYEPIIAGDYLHQRIRQSLKF